MTIGQDKSAGNDADFIGQLTRGVSLPTRGTQRLGITTLQRYKGEYK